MPRQEDLLAEFSVSRPSLREALRILEARAHHGPPRATSAGRFVHSPTGGQRRYSVGLVLQSRGVPMTDLRDALKSMRASVRRPLRGPR